MSFYILKLLRYFSFELKLTLKQARVVTDSEAKTSHQAAVCRLVGCLTSETPPTFAVIFGSHRIDFLFSFDLFSALTQQAAHL